MLAGPLLLIGNSRQNRSITIEDGERHAGRQVSLGGELIDPFHIQRRKEDVPNGA